MCASRWGRAGRASPVGGCRGWRTAVCWRGRRSGAARRARSGRRTAGELHVPGDGRLAECPDLLHESGGQQPARGAVVPDAVQQRPPRDASAAHGLVVRLATVQRRLEERWHPGRQFPGRPRARVGPPIWRRSPPGPPSDGVVMSTREARCVGGSGHGHVRWRGASGRSATAAADCLRAPDAMSDLDAQRAVPPAARAAKVDRLAGVRHPELDPGVTRWTGQNTGLGFTEPGQISG